MSFIATVAEWVSLDDVAPIGVGVDLQYREGPSSLESRKPGDRYGVITPENNRHRSGGKNCRGSISYPSAVAFTIMRVGINVSTVQNGCLGAIWADQDIFYIKIKLLKLPRKPLRRLSDS
jgi:hypothetical protein